MRKARVLWHETAPDVGALPIRSLLVLEELGGVLMSIDSGELQIGRLGFAMAENKTMRGYPTTPLGKQTREKRLPTGKTRLYG